ncbi:MAG: hypothetical protein LH466_06425 [Sphingomonas bacterium]|nr:hypothetical protein [Sphingomonas bacterium]
MRAILVLIPALFAAAPALAAPPPVLPQVLTDPAMADQLGRVAGALTRSLMNVPVGELEAAIEGRPATRADRARTVGDSVGDPYIEQRIAEQAAASGRTMQAVGQAASQALAASLPAIMQAIDGARDQIERAVGNLPDPTYPRR